MPFLGKSNESNELGRGLVYQIGSSLNIFKLYLCKTKYYIGKFYSTLATYSLIYLRIKQIRIFLTSFGKVNFLENVTSNEILLFSIFFVYWTVESL